MDSDKKDFLQVLLYLYLQHAKYKKAQMVLGVLEKFCADELHIMRSSAFLNVETGNNKKGIEKADKIISLEEAPKDTKAFAYLLKCRALWAMGEKELARENLLKLMKTGEAFA